MVLQEFAKRRFMIPHKYNKLIFDGYEELLNRGVPKTQIAEILNERWGTDFPESSLRGRYEREKIASNPNGLDDAEYQEKLFTIAQNDLRLKEQRKILTKQRGMVDAIAREYSEMGAVKQVIADMWGQVTHHRDIELIKLDMKEKVMPIYAYGDVHWGYNYEGYYNKEIAQQRLTVMMSQVVQDVQSHGYKEIYIADLGDQIEGASLRVSQLLRITESMTQQAKEYTDFIIGLMKTIALALPKVKVNYLMISEDNHAQLRLFNTKRDELPENLALLITNGVEHTVSTAHEFGGMLNLQFTAADEIFVSLDGYNIVFAHGHQYGRKDDILEKTKRRHGKDVHLFIGGHWHQYSMKYKNIEGGVQQSLLFLPSIVGDTDFSERLFLSSYPGFAKVTINLEEKIANAVFHKLTL
jgi:hypothetical protein